MQITLETDYAVRCLLYLRDHAGAPSVLGDISAAARVPAPFLSKILQKLIRAGLVRSSKGKGGGFRLARPPARISVYAVMRALCGGGAVLKLVCGRSKDPCAFRKNCRLHAVWLELDRGIRRTLEARALSQL